MRNFHCKGSINHPDLYFNPQTGVLNISGNPPSKMTYYFSDLLYCLYNYADDGGQEITLNLHFNRLLPPFPNPTFKVFLNLIRKLENMQYNRDTSIRVNWFYEESDQGMLKVAEDYAGFSKLVFNLIPY